MNSSNLDEFANSPPELDDFGPPVYSSSPSDLFSNVDDRIINYEFLSKYFDRVSLPLALAKQCLGESLKDKGESSRTDQFVKFIRLSTLKHYSRLPAYEDVMDQLIDYHEIQGFTLQGRLSLWGADDIFCDSNTVFVSHRWKSDRHPDPTGSELAEIVARLEKQTPKWWRLGSPNEVYLWIDYCCLPQNTNVEDFEPGLRSIPNIVKSCDLMVLYSPDYLSRVWCFTELFTWLCKVREVGSTYSHPDTKLFRSLLTRHLVKKQGHLTDGSHFEDSVIANVMFRGFGGEGDDILKLYKPIHDYCSKMEDSASYHLAGLSGGFDFEYLPTLIRFICSSWNHINRLEAFKESDREVCLRVLMESLKYGGW